MEKAPTVLRRRPLKIIFYRLSLLKKKKKSLI
jgi:hypothetical protein